MDFISNLIKRPISVVMTESTEAASIMPSSPSNVTNNTSLTTPPRAKSPSALIATAMNTSISTELTDLLESAVQDLVRIEERNTTIKSAIASSADSTTDTIQQLLHEINQNLDEFSNDDGDADMICDNSIVDTSTQHKTTSSEVTHECIEINLELSPMSPKVKQQHATTDGLGSGAFESNSTLNIFPIETQFDAGNISVVHVDADNTNSKKLTGLSEFDESQIPDLPLGIATDLADDFLPNLNMSHNKQLCSSVALPNKLHNTLINENEMGFNSDSDLFVECQSLNSDKYNNEQSDLDTYRSALNLEDSMERVIEKALEKVSNNNDVLCTESCDLAEPTPSKTVNMSYRDEPMDVDMNETMEMRNVLPQQQQQQMVSPSALIVAQPTSLVEDKKENVVTSLDAANIMPALNNEDSVSRDTLSGYATPHEGVIFDQPQEKLISKGNLIEIAIISDQKNIELYTQKDIRENGSEPEDSGKVNHTLDMTGSFNSMKSTSTRLKSPKTAEGLKTNLTLDMTSSLSSVRSVGSSIKSPTSPSPTFPIKSVVNKDFFPRSPHAPPEKDNMAFLESCVISTTVLTSPTSQITTIPNEKIAESPKPMQTIKILTANSQKLPKAELNETAFFSNKSSPEDLVEKAVLNGTFNNGNSLETNHCVVSELKKDDLRQRRTFSILPLTNESPNSGGTACFPTTDEIRQTFSVESNKEMSPASIAQNDINIDYGAAGDGAGLAMARDISRRKYSLPQENEPTECDEPMDVDQTLPVQDKTPKKEEVSPLVPTHQNQYEDEEKVNSLIPTEQLLRSVSPPLPTHQHRKKVTEQYQGNLSVLPALPTQQRELLSQNESKEKSNSPPLPTHVLTSDDKAGESTKLSFGSKSPLLPEHQTRFQLLAADCTPIKTCRLTEEVILKRPLIHQKELCPNATIVLEDHKLSDKERAKSNAKDEKDVFVDKFSCAGQLDEIFSATPQQSSSNLADPDVKSNSDDDQFYDVEFQPNNNIILNPSDFDYLLTKGNNNVQVDRSSLLLKFDPLLGVPVPLNQTAQQRPLSPTIEENENSFIAEQHQLEPKCDRIVCAKSGVSREFKFPPPVDRTKKHAKMSVAVIDNDSNKTFENSNLQSEDKHLTYNKMDELEKKIKNEVLKTEDVEKKLKDAEQREESFIKRITEKDKTITKLSGVIEAYEKAIAELITEKEQVIQNYERQLNEVKADRDSNYHHLTSLETTFSDLHVKYEKSKEMTSQLKSSEETLLSEKRQILDNLRLQEQRYEKMKNHAMQQLEIANKKLETVGKEHAIESTKLKALLKKEEISRASITEQLQQKTRENAELVKICDELINGQGS